MATTKESARKLGIEGNEQPIAEPVIQSNTTPVQLTEPKDEVLMDIETPAGKLRLVRAHRSGMHAIQQND